MDDSEPTRRKPRLDRRRLLGGMTAIGTAAVTAGCLSSLPMMGQQIRYEPIDVPGRDEPSYRKWIPGGSNTELEAIPSSFVSYQRPAEIVSADVFAGTAYARTVGPVVSKLDYLGVGYENYTALIEQDSLIVGHGSFDASTVRETVLETGYESIDGIDEYAVFRRLDTDRTVAVRDGTVLFGLSAASLEILETAIESNGGRVPLLHETDAGFETISRETGAPAAAFLSSTVDGLGSGLLEENEHRWSANFTVDDGDYLYEVMHSLVADEADVSERRLRDHLEENNRAIEAHSVEIDIDGNRLSIAMQLSDDEIRELVAEPEPRVPPQITWEITSDDGETARIKHLSGDSVDASDLEVTFGGLGTNADRPDQQFADAGETVEPGDSITVGVDGSSPTDELAIFYNPTDDTALALAAHRPG